MDLLIVGLAVLSSFTNANSLSCISMNNQECKTRSQVVNVNGDEPAFFPFSIKTSKCSVSCNNTNYPYANICVPDVVKKLNVKVFNLMSRTNETRFIEWHETCKCECKFGANVCKNKQHWIKNKCRCECKELIDKGACDKRFIWNPSNCECECDKACGVGKYLDYENCKCTKKLVDQIVEECTETVEKLKFVKITPAENENSYICSSCTMHTVLFWIFFTINVGGIGAYFIYSREHLKKTFTRETTIY